MIQNFIKNHLLKKPFRSLLIGAFSFILIFNYWKLTKELRAITQLQRLHPHLEVGKKFYGLNNAFKNIEYVGYYTDKDLSEYEHNKQFSQAQYVIAPTILDVNNTNHEFILFDCTSEALAIKKIQEIEATILKKRSGLILARRKK